MKMRYAEDKPQDCSFCYFWNKNKSNCTLGKENCYYLIIDHASVESPCKGCPYGKYQPCVGWCTRKILGQGGIEAGWNLSISTDRKHSSFHSSESPKSSTQKRLSQP